MKASDRHAAIVQLAAAQGQLGVDELSSRFSVTASTIRRDLATLTADGRLVRTLGGVISPPTHYEASLSERARDGHREKRQIARWAATQVATGDTLLLDAGTTTTELARRLRGHGPLTVATTGLTPFHQLADDPTIELLLLAGRFRPLSQGFIGPLVEASLERMSFDAAFLGADAVTADRGLCEASMSQIRLKELMVRVSQRVYLLAHGRKLGAQPFHAWLRIDRPWTLVTDGSADPGEVARFRSAGVEVVVLPASATTDLGDQ